MNTAELFIDRIEGDVAVLLLDGGELHLPIRLLPPGSREGDVLRLSLERDPEATQRARDEIAKRRRKLGEGDDGGDLKL